MNIDTIVEIEFRHLKSEWLNSVEGAHDSISVDWIISIIFYVYLKIRRNDCGYIDFKNVTEDEFLEEFQGVIDDVVKLAPEFYGYFYHAERNNKTLFHVYKILEGRFSYFPEYNDDGRWIDLISQKMNISNQYFVPPVVVSLSHYWMGFSSNTRVLDLFARKGEWGAELQNSEPEIILHNECYDRLCYITSYFRNLLKTNSTTTTSFIEMDDEYQSVTDDMKHDFVIANPPFDLPEDIRNGSRETSVVADFLKQAISRCNDNGRIAFIVPMGFLFNNRGKKKSDYELRKELTDKKMISAIIRLPDSVFYPHAKIRTALLLIDKGSEHQKIKFVDVFSNSDINNRRFSDILADRINNLEDGSFETYEQLSISSNKVKEMDYDWQINSYKEVSGNESHQSAEDVILSIRNKEKELLKVQASIEGLILIMRGDNE